MALNVLQRNPPEGIKQVKGGSWLMTGLRHRKRDAVISPMMINENLIDLVINQAG